MDLSRFLIISDQTLARSITGAKMLPSHKKQERQKDLTTLIVANAEKVSKKMMFSGADIDMSTTS